MHLFFLPTLERKLQGRSTVPLLSSRHSIPDTRWKFPKQRCFRSDVCMKLYSLPKIGRRSAVSEEVSSTVLAESSIVCIYWRRNLGTRRRAFIDAPVLNHVPSLCVSPRSIFLSAPSVQLCAGIRVRIRAHPQLAHVSPASAGKVMRTPALPPVASCVASFANNYSETVVSTL